ncbi:fimbrial protein [Providencia vermicola]|uniref:fimbrial protein n=1 Tax=Providencia vermicola TaxID=333965 RepID=UPI0032D9CC61
MKFLLNILTLLFLTLITPTSIAGNSANFEFDVKVIAQMCRISITGTSHNEVDFGNVTVADILANKVQPIETKIVLSDCTTNRFKGTYVKISPKNYLDSITFIDDTSKGFGISFSEKNNIMGSSSTTDFVERESQVWKNIDENQLNKTLYTYIRCKAGSKCDPQVGDFQSTVTFSFVVD